MPTTIKKYILVVLSLILSPVLVLAAYNDVELTTDSILTVNGVNLTISGGSALIQSITVSGSTFVVTMPANSHIQVTSTDKRAMSSPETASIQITSSCTDSSNVYGLTNPSTGAEATVTVTVSDSTCNTGSGSGGGGGGSSGGGGSATPAVPATPTVTSATPAIPAVSAIEHASPVAKLVSPAFNRALKPGNVHNDVKRVQQLLNSDPDTRIASIGAGSPGKETTYFGPATTKAIKKFQMKYGIAKPGDDGYGNFGPKTRAKFNEVFGGTNMSVPQSNSALIQQLLLQIQALQAKLNALKSGQ